MRRNGSRGCCRFFESGEVVACYLTGERNGLLAQPQHVAGLRSEQSCPRTLFILVAREEDAILRARRYLGSVEGRGSSCEHARAADHDHGISSSHERRPVLSPHREDVQVGISEERAASILEIALQGGMQIV